MRRAAGAARQDPAGWPVQVTEAFRKAVHEEVTAGRVMCTPPDGRFLLDRWLPSRAAELRGLLAWLVSELGAQPARQVLLVHLRPAPVEPMALR